MLASSLDVTKLLAIYGALLSSIGCGWTLYRDLHDRAKIKVTAGLKRIVIGADGQPYAVSKRIADEVDALPELYIVISFTNVGRRAVMVKGWGGKYRKPDNSIGNFVVIPADMPKMLKEGEFHSESTHDFRGGDDNTTVLHVIDTAGREWRLPKRELNDLKKDIRAARADEQRQAQSAM